MAARLSAAIEPYQDYLSPWEAVQLDCMAAARAVTPRASADRQLFTKRMTDIRNRARQRERLARGVHARSKGNGSV